MILKDSNPVTEKNSSGNQEVFNHYFKTESIYVPQHRITKERNTHVNRKWNVFILAHWFRLIFYETIGGQQYKFGGFITN